VLADFKANEVAQHSENGVADVKLLLKPGEDAPGTSTNEVVTG